MQNETVMAIERECQRVLMRSVNVFDQGDYRGFAELFAPDGVFVRANQPDEPLVGREAILNALLARPAGRLSRHLCTNIEIDVIDENRAVGRCYLLLYTANAADPAPAGGRQADPVQRLGEYRDEYVRTDEGWRIARREGKAVMLIGQAS